jgi:hypothetical protein
MNRILKINTFAALLITALSFAAATSAIAQKPREIRFAGNEVARRAMMPGVSAANQTSYQTGKNFAMAIEDSKTMKDDSENFDYTIVDLVYLIDGLEGQTEAVQLQAILKGIVRGTKDLAAVSREIAAVSNTYLARQTVEQKWYFNVGSAQMNLMYAGWSKDAAATAKSLKDLQSLTKTAPVGTSKLIIEAINGLSKYATLNPFTVGDYGDMVDDAKIITTLVYA